MIHDHDNKFSLISGLVRRLADPETLWANRRLRLVVTGACNISCFYCHNEGQPKHNQFFSHALADRVVQLLPSEPLDAITFTGGEALLHPDLESLVEQFAPHFHRRTLVTNGLLLTPARLDSLLSAGLSKVRLGVDSLTRRKHRPTPGSPTGVPSREVLRMLEESPVDVELNVVLTSFNANEITDILRVCADHQISAKFFEHVKVDTFGGNGVIGSMSRQPYIPFYSFDMAAQNIIGSCGISITEGANTVYYGEGYNIRYCRYLHTYGLCHLTGSRIDATGAVYTCMEKCGIYHITPEEPASLSATIIRNAVASSCEGFKATL